MINVEENLREICRRKGLRLSDVADRVGAGQSNLINSVSDPVTAYYASVTVLIALLASYFGKRDAFRRFPHILLPIFTMALAGGAWALC